MSAGLSEGLCTLRGSHLIEARAVRFRPARHHFRPRPRSKSSQARDTI